MHKINLNVLAGPVKSVEMTFTLQEFATLHVLTFSALASGHPLAKSVREAVYSLPLAVQDSVHRLADKVTRPITFLGGTYGEDV